MKKITEMIEPEALMTLLMWVAMIWFWLWRADYRIGCMFDSSPRTCAILAEASEKIIHVNKSRWK